MKAIRYIFFCCFIMVFSIISQSQTYDQYKKQEEAKFSKYKSDQEKEIKKLAKEFDEYVKNADSEFANFLKQEWCKYQASKGIEDPYEPKPVIIPQHNPLITAEELPARKISVILSSQRTPISAETPVLPIIQKSESEDFIHTKANFEFYGTGLHFEFDVEIGEVSIENINSGSIALWWLECSKTNYNKLVNELNTAKNKLNLNDWAYLELVTNTAEEIFGEDSSNSVLLSWFIMIRSGYNLKIAYNDSGVHLMFPSENILYGRNFLTVDNQNFYFHNATEVNSSFFTYEYDFEGATRKIDFLIKQPLNIGNDTFVKEFTFNHNNIDYIIPVVLSINNIYFLKDYPNTDLNVYFNSAASRVTKESLAEAFIPHLVGLTQNESVSLILAFVQKAFIWYDLNFVTMMHDSGNMLFDYDTDHTQKTVNMKEDILD